MCATLYGKISVKLFQNKTARQIIKMSVNMISSAQPHTKKSVWRFHRKTAKLFMTKSATRYQRKTARRPTLSSAKKFPRKTVRLCTTKNAQMSPSKHVKMNRYVKIVHIRIAKLLTTNPTGMQNYIRAKMQAFIQLRSNVRKRPQKEMWLPEEMFDHLLSEMYECSKAAMQHNIWPAM